MQGCITFQKLKIAFERKNFTGPSIGPLVKTRIYTVVVWGGIRKLKK
jgi:hypothetical protein